MSTFTDTGYTYEIISGTNDVILTAYSGSDTIINKSTVVNGGTTYNITRIADNVFKGIPITSATFGNVTTIGNSAFTSCVSLVSVSFPVTITIGISAFDDCTSLSTVSFPSVITIENAAFRRCAFTTASFTTAITIGDFAFFYGQLTNITLSSIQTIGIGSFVSCKLTSIILPSTISSIGNFAFLSCDRLNNVTFDGSIPSIATQYYDMPGVGETKGYCFHSFVSFSPLIIQKLPITVHYNPIISNADKIRLIEAFQTLDPPYIYTPPITLNFTNKPHNSMQTGIGSVRNFRAKYKRS